MNTTDNFISTGCPANAPRSENKIVKPIKVPTQLQDWKIVSLMECPTPETMQQGETPDQPLKIEIWSAKHILILNSRVGFSDARYFDNSRPSVDQFVSVSHQTLIRLKISGKAHA
jgi:hypothetical protein